MVAVAFASTMSSDPWGGSEELWGAAARSLASKGHDVRACTKKWPSQSPRLTELAAAGVKLSTWRRPGVSRRALLKARIDRRGFRLAPADVLVINQGGTYDLLGNSRIRVAIERARQRQTPYILAVHSNTERPLSHDARSRLRQQYANAAAVVLPSPRLQADFERQLAMRLPNAVAIVTPTPLLGASAPPFPVGEELRLASVARLDAAQKGQDVLLAALAKVSWRGEAWHLDLYGDGPDDAYLRALAQLYGVNENVTFHGHTTDIGRIWIDHHVLVMPSRLEARGIAITEAMASARPTVATAIGGIPDSVVDEQTGLLACATTVDAWVEALERLWNSRDRLSTWGARARANVEAVFTNNQVEAFADLIVRQARTQ